MHKSKYLLLVCALLLSISIAVLLHGRDDKSAYHITWLPPKISTAISPGGCWEGSTSFTSNIDLVGVKLSVPPELEPFVSIYPQSFSNLVAGTVNTLQISIAVPSDATVDKAYEGAITLTVGDRVCAETSTVKLYVAPPLETITEESYNETMQLETEACNLFDESEQSSGTQEARRTTLEFLNEQAAVFDAGISGDGTIWIVYKDGIRALISTSPPGSLGSGSESVDADVLGGTLASTVDYVTPGNKKAILLWPICSDPRMQPSGTTLTLSDLMNEVSDNLTTAGYEVTSVPDANVTVDLLKSMYLYGVVDFVTHGSMDSNQIALMTGEKATFSSFLAHLSDLKAGLLDPLVSRKFGPVPVELTWGILPSFVTHYAAESYPNSLVVATACSSLASDSMANAFLNAGAYVYAGWTGTSKRLSDTGLFECLTQGMSVQQAFSELNKEGATIWADTGAQFCFYPSDRGDYKLTLASNVVSLTVSSTAGGSVTTPREGTLTYNAGTVVDLVATPDAGYQFVNWTGDVGTIGNVNAASTTITMNGDYSIAANFEETQYTPMVAAGWCHTVGLKSDGTVVAVGDTSWGQCNVSGWTDIVQVSAGDLHTVGLKSDGTVVAVGQNDSGQCDVGGWAGIVEVSARGYHTVGLKSDGTVVDTALDVGGWTGIIQVAAGGGHTVGLKSDGTVVAVGDNYYGECDVAGWTDIVQVAAGNEHTVGLKADGTVVAIGRNDNGQCDVTGWTGIIQIAAGGAHTVGLKADGTVVAVGGTSWCSWGQCNVSGWTDIVQVAAGNEHTVGLKADGTVVAVGDNIYGQCNVSGWALS
jgi:hypothetical protein